MDIGLPFRWCTFDNITVNRWRHQVLVEVLFFDNSLFLKKMEPPIKFTLCKQNKHDNIQQLH